MNQADEQFFYDVELSSLSVVEEAGEVEVVAEPTVLQVTDVEIDAAKSNAERIGKSGKSRRQ